MDEATSHSQPLWLDIGRFNYAPDHVAGVIRVGAFECYTLELPWLDNRPGRSCIPEGVYDCQLGIHYGNGTPYECVELLAVPGRSDIEIHYANVPSDILGCIAVGRSLGGFGRQRAVLQSKAAFQRMMETIKNLGGGPGVQRPIKLSIRSDISRYAPKATT